MFTQQQLLYNSHIYYKVMTDVELLSRHALRSYSLFVLYFLLTQGPMSVYEIAQLIKDRSHGQFKATAGNVYPH